MGEQYRGFLYAAYKDKLTVEALLPDAETHSESIAFHSQQMAEKVMKEVFVQNAVVPPKTHAVDDLLAAASEKGWVKASSEAVQAAHSLSMHAVVARYAECPDITRGEALQAVAHANVMADMVGASGYDVVRIESDIHLLRQEGDASKPDSDSDPKGSCGV